MKTLLICPSERPGLSALSRSAPLAALPLLGQSLLEYWLSSLSDSPNREVMILAHDRPEQIGKLAGNGERWGLNISVVAESRELTPAQAFLKYEQELGGFPAQHAISVLDHFPGFPDSRLFNSYSGLFTAMQAYLPRAFAPDRVGYRELRPGLWVSTSARVSPKAQLKAPCWIGAHVLLSDDAIIGPGTVLEDEVMVEPKAELVNSWISSRTYVGRLARVAESVVLGSTLINWQTGSTVQVPDPFLLCSLREPRQYHWTKWFARVAEILSGRREEPSLAWKNLLLNKES